ncbi:MAG: hypothetical protein PVH19_00050 [Planctomycetia bacterium]|jgi:hypothetical protein
MDAMPFNRWPEGKPFEMVGRGGNTRYGVKLRTLTYEEADPTTGKAVSKTANAFMFDTNTLESVSNNKKVSAVRTVRGRLARTHDNRLIVVNEAKKGLWAAYYVNLTGFTTLADSNIDLIPVDVGNRRDEVDIILKSLQTTCKKSRNLLELLEIELTE